MKTSIDWLNDYLDPSVNEADAVAALKQAGFPHDGEETLPLSAGGTATCIDFEVTSNRGDVLSHTGLAREVAAITGSKLSLPQSPESTDPGSSPQGVTLRNDAPDLCQLYTARIIRGVTVGPSPDWLVRRLESIGQRSINNVVDVTNFVLHELGQPLHAFDLNQLNDATIVVRRAAPGEPFTTLDGQAHKLDDRMLVIADASRPVALAGVMGGQNSEVTATTTDVLLESAVFDPLTTRHTSRRLKISTDSSYRFERGIDAWRIHQGSQRAAALILELAGGTLDPGIATAGPGLPDPQPIALRFARCRSLLGIDLSDDRIIECLAALQLDPRREDGRIVCTPPSFRMDLLREVDLIEEVARIHGLDVLPIEPKIHLRARPPQPKIVARRAAHGVLIAHGYHESVTYTMQPADTPAAPRWDDADPVELHASLGWHSPRLRRSVVTPLLVCRKVNQDAGNHGVRLYETGGAFAMQGDQRTERDALGFLADADPHDAGTTLRAVRGMVTELVERLGGSAAVQQLAITAAETNGHRAFASVALDGHPLGGYGLLDADAQHAFDLQTPVVVGELDLAALLARYPAPHGVRELPRFPAIERDLSIVVDEAVTWEHVRGAVEATRPALLETIDFVGLYRGKPIAKGSKSVTLRLEFRDADRTLRHDEVDPQVAQIVDALKAAVAAELRV